MLSSLERFKGICNFERLNDPFIWSVWPWPETIDRWYAEGMEVPNIDSMKHVNKLLLGYENQVENISPRGSITGFGRYGMDPWIVAIDPPFEREILSEDERYVVLRDFDGAKVRRKKENDISIPEFLEYPVQDFETWNEYKKRLDPFSPGRWLKDWDKMMDKWLSFPIKDGFEGKSWEDRDFPLGFSFLSLYGNIRNYMGVENLSYAIYDEPRLVEEMLDRQIYLAEEMLKKVYASGITLDYVFIWEDMCYNKGSLVSPKWVREFMLPRYKRVTEILQKNKCGCIALDSDGNVEDLLPIWLEAGINTTYPLERTAGMDALALRKKYGKDLLIIGNVDKRALAAGKSEIDKEVDMIREMIKTGGYFVNTDHFIPPDVSYENIKYFIDEVKKLGR